MELIVDKEALSPDKGEIGREEAKIMGVTPLFRCVCHLKYAGVNTLANARKRKQARSRPLSKEFCIQMLRVVWYYFVHCRKGYASQRCPVLL